MQRMLSRHPQIATETEPWLLLPLLYALKEKGVAAEYGHTGVHAGVEDFIQRLPKKEDDYLESVAKFARDIYSKSTTQDESYFLDKTPRNSLVSCEIMRAFPNDKFIFLWRNPLAIAASMIETFGHGNWNLYRFEVDLYKGLDCLLSSAKKYESCSGKVMFIQYEDFVCDTAKILSDVYRFLELDGDIQAAESLEKNSLKGRLGDPTGVQAYKAISTASLNKWQHTFASPVRKRWARNYLRRIGKDNLAFMGYDLDVLLCELDEKNAYSSVLSDLARMSYGKVYRRFNIPVLRHSLMQGEQWKYPLY